MKNIQIVIIAFLMCVGCRQSKKQNHSDSKKEEQNIKINYSTVSDIPEILMDTIIALSEDSFRLANPNESFQATDRIRRGERLPWRQLRLLQQVGNTWQMTYKHGGVGLHYHYVECIMENHRILELITGVTLSKLETSEDIDEMKKLDKLTIKDTSSSEEIDKL